MDRGPSRAAGPEETPVILTIAQVVDVDRFLRVFSTTGAVKRRDYGCRSAWVFRDPGNTQRIWAVLDWDREDYERFLTDPGVPAIARDLGVTGEPLVLFTVAELDS